MNKQTKEIVKICCSPKMAEWLRKQAKDWNDGDIYWDKSDKEFEYSPEFWGECFWLPISFDTQHGCLQVEWLLMKKLGIKNLEKLQLGFCDWCAEEGKGIDGFLNKSYVLQCLYWLKELIEEAK